MEKITHSDKDLKSAKPSESFESLKDLNTSDTKELSSVLHGRKASTYLRIFRDKESITTKEKTHHDKSPMRKHSQVSYKHKTRDILKKDVDSNSTLNDGHRLTKNLILSRRNSANRRDDLINLSPKSVNANNTELHRNDINLRYASPGRSRSNNTDPDSQDESSQYDDLSLKPVSSATYYPHKSKLNSLDAIDMQDGDQVMAPTNNLTISQDSPLLKLSKIDNNIKQVNPNIERSDNITACDSNSNNQLDVEDRDQEDIIPNDINNEHRTNKYDSDEEDEEEDDEEDDREYPLAVELKPFTNKVGGHTAIFRFSKRAVCKALVKRENRWYETMELTNDKLLKFMPRYIGVLNVRQHFNSREEFLDQIPSSLKPAEALENEGNDKEDDSQKLTANAEFGAPLRHIHSIVTSSPHTTLTEPKKNKCCNRLSRTISSIVGYDHSYPEVSLDDNKHIIPESLWDRYTLSSEMDPDARDINRSSDRKNPDSGYTTINTKLKDLILQEVFAPIYSGKDHEGMYKRSSLETPTRTVSGRYMKKKTRSSSSSSSSSALTAREMRGSNVRRDSNFSLKEDQFSQSPLMNKSIKETISNAIDSSYSVMDLQQFHKKESVRENSLNPKESDHQNETANININKHTNGHEHKHSQSKCRLHKKISKHEIIRHNPDDSSAIHDSDEDDDHSRLQNTPPESITFEENTDTIVSKFILLEDLTRHMTKPCALDLKMGTRQYGVDAGQRKQISQRTKCLKTTSRRLGVRICGLKIWNNGYYIKRDKYFGRRVRVGWQFVRTLARFLYDGVNVKSIVRMIPRLVKEIDSLAVEISNLKGFRLYGASLLLMYDGEPSPDIGQGKNLNSSTKTKKNVKIKVNLIDFAKCVTKEDLLEGIKAGLFKIPPRNPEFIDLGFLRGLKSLKFYLMAVWKYLTIDEPISTTEDELNDLLLENQEMFDKPWDWLDEFDKENEVEFNDPNSELRKRWRKYELIFDVEPRYNNDGDVSD